MNNAIKSNRYETVSSVMQMYDQHINRGRVNVSRDQNETQYNIKINHEGQFRFMKIPHVGNGSSPTNNQHRYNVFQARRKSRQIKINSQLNESKNNVNMSQQTIKMKANETESIEKNMMTSKGKKNYKSPQWLKHRKKAQNIAQSSKNIKLKQPNQFNRPQTQTTISSPFKNDRRIRCESNAQLRASQSQNMTAIATKKPQPEFDSKWHTSASRHLKMQYLQFNNIKLEEEVKQLKYRLENLEQDNNILLGRMMTMEVELGICHKKLNDCFMREDYHRNVQIKLKERIQDLQSKLIIAKDQINGKNQLCDSTSNEGITHAGSSDREVVNRKNQEISRLNQIINKTRNKVNELNHQLSQQRIKNLQNLKTIQHRFQVALAQSEFEIKQLKQYINNKRYAQNQVAPQPLKSATQSSNFRKAQEQFMKRIGSMTALSNNGASN